MAERSTASPGSSEPDSPGGLNRGCLLDPGEALLHDLSIIVPETPRPVLVVVSAPVGSLSVFGPQVAVGGSPGPEKPNGDLIGQRRRHGRGRRRNILPDFAEDLQGDDYEALLEFEERQGAVVSKKMTRREIQRFPTKTFRSATNTGNTQ
ncbi:hypothetical protein GOODEAATRI_028364 [Goodea atripinnis]|uniref:Uncharacterized protein n=1 Tax=Goodea atripinnis TaxID=208336 RepID=A0ABV0Q1R0_9TELE